MSLIDDFIKDNKPHTKGLVWLSILIEYDYDTGKSHIVRSFTKPAKESMIKAIEKERKDKEPTISFTKVDEDDKESLF